MGITTSASSTSATTWDESRWQRYGLLAGVVFVALNVVGLVAAGTPPARDASAEKITKYFVDNESGIKLGAILFGVALIFGGWWLGSLWRVIGRLETDGPRLAFIAATGFILSAALASVAQAMLVVPALRIATLGGASEFAWSLGYVLFSFVMATTAVHMLALAALIMWKRFLPTWTAWLALLSAVACAVATAGAGTESGFFVALQVVGFLTWLLWVLLASLLLYRKAP